MPLCVLRCRRHVAEGIRAAWAQPRGDRHGLHWHPSDGQQRCAVMAGYDTAEMLLALYESANMVHDAGDSPITLDTVEPAFTAVALTFLTRY